MQKRTVAATASEFDALVKESCTDMSSANRKLYRVLYLNASGELVSTEDIPVEKTPDGDISFRKVFLAAVRSNAAGMVLLHRTASGIPMAEAEDVKMTRALADAGRILGIELLDHVLISDYEPLSFRAAGLFLSRPDREAC